jgi:alkylation response protein AidB-like acyl-CoA dehydrogenase
MNDRIGGVTALAKGHGSQICEFVLREASQIFGGLSYTRGGVGGKVERLYRWVSSIHRDLVSAMVDFLFGWQ